MFKDIIKNSLLSKEKNTINEIEIIAWKLNGIEPKAVSDNNSLSDRLASIKMLLERIQRNSPVDEPVKEFSQLSHKIQKDKMDDSCRQNTPGGIMEAKENIEDSCAEIRNPIPLEVIEEVLALMDYCYAAREHGSESEKSISTTAFEWLEKILSLINVEIIMEVGRFQPGIQHIVGRVSTEIQSQDQVIKSTIRLGYRLKKQLMRAQEVIIYGYDSK